MTIWPFFILTVMLGACVGSFLNVVVYRLPLGLSLVTPPSTCPKCNTRIAIYDNVPVFGWLWLRGRCRNCANPISPQYPILEAFCALMFGMLFLAYFYTGDRVEFYAMNGRDAAAVFALHLVLLAGLIAASKIDANLFIIPLEIPWWVTAAALILVPAAAYGFPASRTVLPIASPWVMGAAIGGGIGLIIAFILLKRGILPMSFLEPQQVVAAVEKPRGKKGKKQKNKKGEPERKPSAKDKGVATAPAAAPATDAAAAPPPISVRKKAFYLLVVGAIAIAMWLIGSVAPESTSNAPAAPGLSFSFIARFAAFVLLWWGVLIVDFGAYGNPKDLEGAGPEHWYVHPRPRYESMKEVLYLALPILGAVIGFAIGNGPAHASLLSAPLWLKALGGSVFGYLAGCAIVWGVRILGTLGFGKEAMGLGDVHLVGAIGAVIGAGDAVIAFLLAAFFGLGYALVEATLGRLLVKRGVQIPYGPHLCGAAIVLMMFKTPIRKFLVDDVGLTIPGW